MSHPVGMRVVLVFCLSIFISACVRPVDPTPIPQPTDIPPLPTPTQPPILGATFPSDVIVQWLQNSYGTPVSNLITFMQLQVGPDDVVGYTYQDVNGQRCAGVVLTTAATSQIWNGDVRCVPAGTAVIAGATLLALTNGEPYVATFIHVDPALLPDANAVAITFPDGSSLPANNADGILRFNGYVALKAGVQFPSNAVVIGQTENTLTQISIQ